MTVGGEVGCWCTCIEWSEAAEVEETKQLPDREADVKGADRVPVRGLRKQRAPQVISATEKTRGIPDAVQNSCDKSKKNEREW